MPGMMSFMGRKLRKREEGSERGKEGGEARERRMRGGTVMRDRPPVISTYIGA